MLERWTNSNRGLKEIHRKHLCDNLIVYEGIEIKIACRIPIGHAGVAHNDWVEQHGILIEVSKCVESVHRLAEIDRIVHYHGVGRPRRARQC